MTLDSESQKRVGILGGSFNPVHLGHLHIAHHLRLRCDLDEVWFVPANRNPHKQELPIASSEHRIKMLELATGSSPFYKVIDVECRRQGPSYTVETLEYFCKNYPHHQFYLLLGADSVKRFHEWKAPYKILGLARLVVASRKSQEILLDYGDSCLEKKVEEAILRIPLLEASSTAIRSQIEKGESCVSLLPPLVYDYILHHRLYRS